MLELAAPLFLQGSSAATHLLCLLQGGCHVSHAALDAGDVLVQLLQLGLSVLKVDMYVRKNAHT